MPTYISSPAARGDGGMTSSSRRDTRPPSVPATAQGSLQSLPALSDTQGMLLSVHRLGSFCSSNLHKPFVPMPQCLSWAGRRCLATIATLILLLYYPLLIHILMRLWPCKLTALLTAVTTNSQGLYSIGRSTTRSSVSNSTQHVPNLEDTNGSSKTTPSSPLQASAGLDPLGTVSHSSLISSDRYKSSHG